MTMSRLELKVPPPLIGVISAAAMLVLARIPSFGIDFPGHTALAVLFATIGSCFFLASGTFFRRARTTFSPIQPEASSALVTTGPYRLSRNPMYLGLLLVLCGWALFLARPLPFLLLPAFVAYMNRFQIVPEERALTHLFGQSYIDYRHKIRRWL